MTPPRGAGAELERGMAATMGLEAAMRKYESMEDLPGGVLIVLKYDKPCFLKSFGMMDVDEGKPMINGAIFRSASMTKITTSFVAMMLYDRGMLLLDEPVSKYIPSFAAMTRVTGSSEDEVTPCSTAITVRHLMNHTSGLTYGFFDGTGPAGVVDKLHRALPRVGATSTTGADALAECPLAFEPGSAFRYSNATAVLGRVVTVAAGVPLDEFFQKEVCEPLGMMDTAYFVPPEKQGRVATAYTRLTAEEVQTGFGSVRGGWKAAADKQLVRMPDATQACPDGPGGFVGADGGLFTTASDWGKFMAMVCEKGAQLLSQTAWEIMVAPSTPNLATVFNSHWTDPADTAGPFLCANHRAGGFAHSLCGEVVVDSSLAGCGPCSDGTFGWEGIFTTKFMIDPTSGVSWAAFSQVHPCWDHNLKVELGPLIFSAMEERQAKL